MAPRALALFASVISFGRIMGDLDNAPVDPDEWAHVVQLAIGGLFNVEPDDRDAEAAEAAEAS